MNALVVSIEALGKSLVGTYGSENARTPCLDQLAAQGAVLDQCFVDSLSRDHQLVSLWTGRHALQHQSQTPDELRASTIWRVCEDAQTPACLITDDPYVAEFSESLGCQDAVLISAASSDGVDATGETQAVHFFAVAAEVALARAGLVWIHSRGMRGPWDAPLELRATFCDEEDPDPPAEVGPPDLCVDGKTDPDLVVGWGQTAMAQAHLLDAGLETLLAAIGSREDSGDWSGLVCSLGGTPLGEHGQVGFPPGATAQKSLYSEEIQCTAQLWTPHRGSYPLRRNELFQLPDLAATVFSMLEVDPVAPLWGRNILDLDWSDSPVRWPREFTLAYIDETRSNWIRCPAWSLFWENQALADSAVRTAAQMQGLFVKPEDRWDVNDVTSRCPDVIENLEQLAQEFRNAIETNQRGGWPELSTELVELIR